MTYEYIEDLDILNIRVASGAVARTVERPKTIEDRCPSILVDVDASGRTLGIEILGASRLHPKSLLDVLGEFGLLKSSQVA